MYCDRCRHVLQLLLLQKNKQAKNEDQSRLTVPQGVETASDRSEREAEAAKRSAKARKMQVLSKGASRAIFGTFLAYVGLLVASHVLEE